MMSEQPTFSKQTRKIGKTLYFSIPKEIASTYNISEKTHLIIKIIDILETGRDANEVEDKRDI